MSPATSNRYRMVFAVLLFGGLAALEVVDGLDRIGEVRERRRRELIDLVDGQQEALVREVGERIGDGRRHASHLARHPFTRELLLVPEDGPAAVDRLGRILAPYLASFSEIDRLRILDAEARERFRCERMGGGVATIPRAFLDAAPADRLAALAAGSTAADVSVSRLTFDAERVEVAPEDRLVFHLVAPVRSGDERIGVVVVTVYAAPLLHALAGFEPLPGTTTCLLDADGNTFAPLPGGSQSRLDCAGIVEAAPTIRASVLEGEHRIETPEAFLFARAAGVDPAAFLVSAVPQSVLVPKLPPSEALGPMFRTLLVLSAIGLGSAFFVRASQRAARLAETESYARRIREESEKQRALMEAAADMILVVETGSELVEDWNPHARELLALDTTSGPLPLEAVSGVFEHDGSERLRAGIREASRQPGRAVLVAELALLRDGARLDLDARCVGFDHGGRRLVKLSLGDRTREREMERRARTAERLSALGLLTAGVAHEINNPLEGIANYLTLLERTDDPARREELMAQVRRGFQRIREITGELLHLARPAPEGGSADLRGVVERALSMARFSRELLGVEVRTEGFEAGLVVPGSGGGLEQVVLNLLLNAGRAMGGAGRILVRGTRIEGDRVELAVEDEGPGIAASDLDRIFDPFFTRSGGTGLGLSVSYQIARAHGGDLSAENLSGGGARLVLCLPLFADGERRPEGGA